MARRYAATTDVPADKSIAEALRFLEQRDAEAMPLHSRSTVAIQFQYAGKLYRLSYPVPPADSFDPGTRFGWGDGDARARWQQQQREQERMRLWRVVLMRLKLAFEDIGSGERTAEQVLLPFIVLPNGQTVEEWMLPGVARAYVDGTMPRLEDAFGPPRRPALPAPGPAVRVEEAGDAG